VPGGLTSGGVHRLRPRRITLATRDQRHERATGWAQVWPIVRDIVETAETFAYVGLHVMYCAF